MADYYAQLRAELADDPAELGYAGMSDAEAAAAFNARTRPAPVPKGDVLRYVVENALWKGIADLAADDGPYAPAAASAVRAFEPGDFATIDMNRPAVVGLMDALAAGGALTAEHKAAILALAANRTSRREELGIGCTGIFLATPAYAPIIFPFYDAMKATCGWLHQNGVPYALATSPGDSLVTRARNSLVAAFMASSCSHLLFIDADMSWEPIAVTRLLAVDKDMVCGVYPKKQLPLEFVFNVQPGPDGGVEREPETGLIEISHAPTGFLVIRRAVLERMMAAYPELAYRERDAPAERQPFTFALFDCQAGA